MFLHSCAALMAELSDMRENFELDVRDYLYVIVELPAHVLTFAALLINLIGALSDEDESSLIATPSRATAARELFAIAVVLQWACGCCVCCK
jgi:hypothetical protein|eukprot:4354240-Prymnesium_polylepis.2